MTVLGLDQSTSVTGYCVFEDNTYKGSGVLNKKKNAMDMADAICETINKVKPDKVIIEDVYQSRSVTTLVVLARLQGVLQYYCYKKNIPLEIIAPNTWRKIVGIKKRKREEAKAEAIQLVQNLYGLQITNDEAEAVLLTKASCE